VASENTGAPLITLFRTAVISFSSFSYRCSACTRSCFSLSTSAYKQHKQVSQAELQNPARPTHSVRRLDALGEQAPDVAEPVRLVALSALAASLQPPGYAALAEQVAALQAHQPVLAATRPLVEADRARDVRVAARLVGDVEDRGVEARLLGGGLFRPVRFRRQVEHLHKVAAAL